MDASDLATRLVTAPGDLERVELLAKRRESLLQLLALVSPGLSD